MSKKLSAKKEINNFLWVEKYRPKSCKSLVLPKDELAFLQKIVTSNQTPNLILESRSPGSGKTTVGHAIIADLNASYIYLNASLEGNIEMLRDDLTKFASTKGFATSKATTKIVLLDEVDGASPKFQESLRGFIEQFYKNCRFIMTCNNVNKIIPALREGRVMEFSFDMTKKSVREEMIPKVSTHMQRILKHEGVEFDKATVDELVTRNYPNIRKTIASLQKFSMMKGVIGPEIFSLFAGVDEELYKAILNKKTAAARKIILDNGYDYAELYTDFYENFIPMMPKEARYEATIITAEYQHKHVFAVDGGDIPFAAYIIELIKCL